MTLFVRIFLGMFVIFSTLALLGAAAGGWWVYQKYSAPGSLEEPVTIVIPYGTHIGGVAEMLYQEDVISSPFIFVNAGKITGQAGRIKAGEYAFEPYISMKQILDLLEEGKTVQRTVMVREGLTSYQILSLLSEVEALDQAKIDVPAEGSLLPETYSYSKGESVGDVIRRMEEAMVQTIDALWHNRAPDLPIKTKEEALVLASVIEKETGHPSERRRVAGVFVNRLRKGMPLQTDPSVIYALTEGKPQDNGHGPLGRRLLSKDLKFDSPYNTYLYAGLPPGPIANPGRASIEAALNPEEHGYFYFVADGTGGHAFAENLAEHNNNVQKWRKIRRAQ